MDTPETIDCPECGEIFAPADASLQECPVCLHQFFITDDTQTDDISAEDVLAREMIEKSHAEEKERLDNRHIKLVYLEKQSLYRARTWMLIAAMLCVGGCGQLIWLAFRQPSADPLRTVSYCVVAIGLLIISLHFFKRARHYRIQAQDMRQPEPADPPDFSTLRNGSQIVDELHKMSENA